MMVIKRGKAISHVGETNMMNCGKEATIISYNTRKDIIVEFKGYNEIVNSDYSNFEKGRIKSNYSTSVYGVGYLGIGKYTAYDNNNIITPQYRRWKDMLCRCYGNKSNNKAYIGCSVCSEWLCFQAFAEWYDRNYYKIDNEDMHLDKDILCKGNKIYSPIYCVFVPQYINKIFTKSNMKRGDNPIGVSLCKNGSYQSKCSVFENNKKRTVYLGIYNNKIEAFNKYKSFKEDYIKKQAENYRNKIPSILYNAMCIYKIEITD